MTSMDINVDVREVYCSLRLSKISCSMKTFLLSFRRGELLCFIMSDTFYWGGKYTENKESARNTDHSVLHLSTQRDLILFWDISCIIWTKTTTYHCQKDNGI